MARVLALVIVLVLGCSSKRPNLAAWTNTGVPAGTGGATAAIQRAVVPRRRPVYPLGVSENKRYLVGRDGMPFLLAGDSPQCLTARLSVSEMQTYFATRAQQGFNAAWVNALCTKYTGGNEDATTLDGIAPFLAKLGDGHYDLTRPNPAFFARVDAAVAAAAQHGIVLFLDPIETGGFLDTLRANGLPNVRSYGRFVGQRYVASENIVWLSGNDFRAWLSGTDDALVREVALGIKDSDARHLQTVELDYPKYMSALDDPTWEPLIDINTTYTYHPTYAQLYVDYNRSNHLPNVMIEGNYEGENASSAPHVTNAHDCRTQYYWSNLSGATGSFYGNKHIWPILPAWKDHLADPGAVQIGYGQALFQSRAWHRLVPDQTNSVVFSGLGDRTADGNAQDNTYATAARTDDGTLVMVYLPTARAVAVDMTKLAGPVTARWFDPTTGTYSPAAGGTLRNTGMSMFTPLAPAHADGFTDWVLVLETNPVD